MLQLTAIGRLTKDPEFKVSRQSNAQFLVFDLAVNKGYGNNQTTVFINCCASESVKNALSKAKKGSHVAVTGDLSTEIYQKNDGSTGENIKCFVTSFSFINSGNGQKNNQQNGNYAPQQNNNQYAQPPMNNGQQYQQPPMNNGQQYQQPPMNNGQQYQQPPMNNGQQYQQSPMNNGQQYQQPPVNQGYAPANQYANPNNYGNNYPAGYQEQNVTGEDLPF